MNKIGKRIIAAGLCTGMAMLALTGCSGKTDKDAVVATVDGTEIKLGEMLVALRVNQANTETYLGSLFGEGNMWEQDLTGTGTAYGTTFKEDMLASMKEMVILEQHMADYNVEITEDETAAIEAAAAQFIADNDAKAMEAMGATEETVARVLTLYTVQDKMNDAIIADVDRNVSDEEAAQKSIEYTLFSTAATTDEEGNTVELTDEEKEAVKQQAIDTIELVKGGKTFEEALKEVNEDKTTIKNTYGADSILAESLTSAADTLADGEIYAEPIEVESGWYVVQMISTFDEEATATEKEEIIAQRESDLYDEVLAGWEPESYEVNSEVWATIDFNDQFLVETEAATEAASEDTTTEVTSEAETTEAETTEVETTEAASEAATTEAETTEAATEVETTEAASETEVVSETETESESK